MLTKNIKRTAICALCILLSLLCFTSCGAKMKLEFESGSIVSKDDLEYSPVPLAYKPRTYIEDDKFATLKHPIYGKINLYEVEGTNGEWIYCPTDDTLYALAGVTVPTLEQMAPTSALISTNGDKELSLAVLEDREVVSTLANIISSGEEYAVGDNALIPVKTYKLSFISPKYAHIVYSVTYYEYSDGTYRLYDRDMRLYYEIGDDIHKLLNTSEETTADTTESTSPES